MRVQVLVIAGPDADPALFFNRTTLIYPDVKAESSDGHLLDVSAFVMEALEDAKEEVAVQVSRLANVDGS